jgi:hypothetical protein
MTELRIPSSRASKSNKMKQLLMLSDNLRVFKPEYERHFLCPACMEAIPLRNSKEITEAHIIPKAAAGKLSSYLCSKCNNSFGSNQDRWFGEYLKSIDGGIPKLISTDISEGTYWIDDIKINGAWREDKAGSLNFYVREDWNSPATNILIKERLSAKPPKLSLRVSIPILKNRKLIDIGFLTAAYLMWFRELGYSWVFQEYLNPIREQIRNPHRDILNRQFIVACEGIRWKPWIGLVTIDEELLLAMGLENILIIFPPADRPNIYSKLAESTPKRIGKDIRPIQFWKRPFYGPSVYVMYEDRYLVFPNALHSMSRSTTILFTRTSTKGQILYPTSRERLDFLKKTENVESFKPEFSPCLQNWDIKERK